MQQEYCAHHNVPAFFMKNYKGKFYGTNQRH